MRRYRSLLLILLVGIVPAAALLVSAWVYLGQESPPSEPVEETLATPEPTEPPEPTGPPPVEVIAAARDLTVGTLLTANDVAYVPLAPGAVLSGHMRRETTEISTVVGSVVRIAVLADMPLTGAALVSPGQEGFLAAALTPNHRALNIQTDQATSQAGLIAPGDRVDVIFTMAVSDGDRSPNTYSRTILEDIRVVAVTGNILTLELLPSAADRLVLATTEGSLSFTLRPLGQSDRRGRRPPTGLRAIMPPPATPEILPDPVRVQVFRGESREEVLLAK